MRKTVQKSWSVAAGYIYTIRLIKNQNNETSCS